MPTQQSIVSIVCRTALVLSLTGVLASCVDNPEDGAGELSDDLGAAEQSAASGDTSVSVSAASGSRSIKCTITARAPYRVASVVYGISKVTCSNVVSNIAVTSYLNRGGFRWKQASDSRTDLYMVVQALGGCSGTNIYRTETSYNITFPSGYSVVSGSTSGSFKSAGTPTISC